MSPIEAGRAAAHARQSRSSNPYRLDAPTRSERAMALAWVRAWDAANRMPLWEDDADPDTDPPILGPGSTGWRRAQLFEEYVLKRYGPDIQVSVGHDIGGPGAFVLGRGDRLVFMERTASGSWGCSDDPDVARWAGVWPTSIEGTTAAITEAVKLLDPR